MISARNQIAVEILQIKTGTVNSLIIGKAGGGEILKATITTDSKENLELRVGKMAIFLFKASSVMIAKNNQNLKLSAANQINGKIASIKTGSVNSEIEILISGGDILNAIITNESVENLDLNSGDEIKAIIKATQIIVGVNN